MDAFRQGAFSWCELLTTDVEAAKKFYSELFGWNIEPVAGALHQDMQYNLVKVDGTEIGGIMAVPPQAQGMPPSWGTYVTVDDVDAAAAKVRELGGDIVVPLTDIPEVGRFCVIKDPQGAVISMITYLGTHS